MTATTAVLVAAVLLGAVVQGLTGFGFALAASPLLVSVVEPATAVSVVMVLGLVASASALAATAHRLDLLGREAAVLLAAALPGLVAGTFVLARLPADALRAGIGVIVLLALAQRLAGGPRRTPPAPVTGFVAGALTTAGGINGPPLVLHLTARAPTAQAARDTVTVLLISLGVLGLAGLAIGGELALPGSTPLLAATSVGGAVAGRLVTGRIPEGVQRRAIDVTLAAAGATAILAAVL